MKKNLLGWFAMATMLVGTGCSSDEVVNDYSPENAIQFGTYVGRDAQGRASIFETDDLQGGSVGFGVYAYYTGQQTWHAYKNNTTPLTPNFMNNTQVTYDGTSSWTYSPLKYWPNNTNDKVSFFAYAPYSTTTSQINAVTNGVISFEVANTVTDQIDLTVATTNQVDKVKTDLDQTVEFKFNHVLSRIDFTLQAAADQVATGGTINNGTTITLTKIVIGEADHTTVTDDNDKFYTNADYSIFENSWSNKTGMQAFTLTTANFAANQNVLNWTSDGNVKKTLIAANGDDYIMVIPAEITNLPIYVEYTVFTEGKNAAGQDDNSTVYNKITKVLDKVNFEQGKSYTFNLVLGMSTVELTAEVEDWGANTETNVDLPQNEE